MSAAVALPPAVVDYIHRTVTPEWARYSSLAEVARDLNTKNSKPFGFEEIGCLIEGTLPGVPKVLTINTMDDVRRVLEVIQSALLRHGTPLDKFYAAVMGNTKHIKDLRPVKPCRVLYVTFSGCPSHWIMHDDAHPHFRGWNGEKQVPVLNDRIDHLRKLVNSLIRGKVGVLTGESGIGKTGLVCCLPAGLSQAINTPVFGIYVPELLLRKDPIMVGGNEHLVLPSEEELGNRPMLQQEKDERDRIAYALILEIVKRRIDAILGRGATFDTTVSLLVAIDDAATFEPAAIRGIVSRHQAFEKTLCDRYGFDRIFIVVAGTGANLRHDASGDMPHYDIYRLPAVSPEERLAIVPGLDPVKHRWLWTIAENFRCLDFIAFYCRFNPSALDNEMTTLRAVGDKFYQTNGLSEFPDQLMHIFGVAWRALFDLPIADPKDAEILCTTAGLADDLYDGTDDSMFHSTAKRYKISPALRLLLLDRFSAMPSSASPDGVDGFWSSVVFGAILAVQAGCRIHARKPRTVNAAGTTTPTATMPTMNDVLNVLKVAPAMPMADWSNNRPHISAATCELLDRALPAVIPTSAKLSLAFGPKVVEGKIKYPFDNAVKEKLLAAPKISVVVNREGGAHHADVMVWVTWPRVTEQSDTLNVALQVHRRETELPPGPWNESFWVMGSCAPGLLRAVGTGDASTTLLFKYIKLRVDNDETFRRLVVASARKELPVNRKLQALVMKAMEASATKAAIQDGTTPPSVIHAEATVIEPTAALATAIDATDAPPTTTFTDADIDLILPSDDERFEAADAAQVSSCVLAIDAAEVRATLDSMVPFPQPIKHTVPIMLGEKDLIPSNPTAYRVNGLKTTVNDLSPPIQDCWAILNGQTDPTIFYADDVEDAVGIAKRRREDHREFEAGTHESTVHRQTLQQLRLSTQAGASPSSAKATLESS